MSCQRVWVLAVFVSFAGPLLAAAEAGIPGGPVRLEVEAGTPLRLYLTHRVWYRVGEPVSAKVLNPVWAFDRIVIPAGASATGKITELDPLPKMVRARAIVGGDFTPLKYAKVAFSTLTFPDGRVVPISTEQSVGLPIVYSPPRAPKKSQAKAKPAKPDAKPNAKTPPKHTNGTAGFVRQQLTQQATSQLDARSHGLYSFVRGPNKKEWIENYLLSKAPYHPQWYRSRTRIDAILSRSVDFGSVQIGADEYAPSGAKTPAGSIGEMRILKTVSSGDASVGDPVQGVLSAPLFAPEHKLVLPQGTHFLGRVTLARRARLFHRGGKLRFSIDTFELPQNFVRVGTRSPELKQVVQGQLAAAESDPKTLKVDQEGTATATDSKERFLRPAIAALIAAKSLDNDTGKQTAAGGGDGNGGGRALGGFSGFGLLGTAASFGPRTIGPALGFYGLAFSVYSTIIARGGEVTFEKNAPMAIQFGNTRNR